MNEYYICSISFPTLLRPPLDWRAAALPPLHPGRLLVSSLMPSHRWPCELFEAKTPDTTCLGLEEDGRPEYGWYMLAST